MLVLPKKTCYRALCRSIFFQGGIVRFIITCVASLILTCSASFALKKLDIEYHSGKVIRLRHTPHTLYLTQPDVADYVLRAPGVVFISGKKIGHTRLQVLNKKGHILETYQIHVTYPASDLLKLIRKVAPKSRVSVETVGHYLLLKGSVSTTLEHQKILHYAQKFLKNSENLVDLIKVNEQSQQINLRVKLVEISRELHKAVGLDFSAGFMTPNHFASFGVNTTGLTDSTVSGATNIFDFSNNKFGNFTVSALLKLLDQEKLATVLAEPNITTVSGKAAVIEVGGEVPISSSTTGLIPTTRVNYKKYGIKLSFTPELLANGRIRVKVEPSVSRPIGDPTIGLVNPAFLTRSVSTTVELMSGQSFAIAGLLQNQLSEKAQQMPGVDGIPILKDMFRQEESLHTEREFVIVIVPYIVHPTRNGMEHMIPTKNQGMEIHKPGFIAH